MTTTCTFTRSCRRTHRNYLMTCEEFAELDDRAQGRCEICGRPAERNPSGQLYIDHRSSRWSVRGLLCNPCNTVLTKYTSPTPEQQAYLDRSWYLGLDMSLRIEPPSNVYRVAGRWSMTWQRRRRGGWESVKYGKRDFTWWEMWIHNGPHLRIVGVRDDVLVIPRGVPRPGARAEQLAED